MEILKISQKTLNGSISNKEAKFIQLQEKYDQLSSELKNGDHRLIDKEK